MSLCFIGFCVVESPSDFICCFAAKSLGPLLFLIFVNDAPDSIPYYFALLFADDNKLPKSKQTYNDSIHLQRIMTQWLTFYREWELNLNGSNVQWFVFHYYQNVLLDRPTYTIKGTSTETTTTHCDLEVIVDQNLL